MNHCRRIEIYFALLLTVFASPAHTAEGKNLAHEISFVWQVAENFAAALQFLLKSLDPPVSDEFEDEAKHQFAIIHYHLLIECGGPLPRLAIQLRDEVYESPQQGYPVPVDVGSIIGRPEVSKTLNDWHSRRFPRIIKMFEEATYGFHPACIEPAFLRRNPPPSGK